MINQLSRYIPCTLNNNLTLVGRGNPSHYNHIRNHIKIYRKHQFRLYNQAPIDICFRMVSHQQSIITYITNNYYETVTIKKSGHQQWSWKNKINDQYGKFLNENEFVVLRSYIDIHPLAAYKRVCGYLQLEREDKHINIFNGSFSKQIIQQHLYVPYLTSLRDKYLITNQLKLKRLDRKRQATQQQQKQGIKHWQEAFFIKNIEVQQQQTKQQKLKWIIDNAFYETVDIVKIVQGYGQRQYHAYFQL